MVLEQDITIAVRDVSKNFPGPRPLSHRLLGRAPQSGFQALSNVNLDIRKGETVGLLGVNGAGKSTLLQLIAGTMLPSAGSVTVKGRISALLELGAGFNPEWSGRMNSEFYCRIQGIEKRLVPGTLQAIESFADIGGFFDQPVRTYSSGMFLRVAFAAAVAVDPDIVIVDEALAVGDARFQNKCFARIKQLQDEGKTILFVTHDVMTMSRFCTRGVVLSKGRMTFDGQPEEAVRHYRRLLYGASELEKPADADAPQKQRETEEAPRDLSSSPFSWPPDLDALKAQPYYNSQESLAGIALGQIVDMRLVGAEGANVRKGSRLRIAMQVRATEDVEVPSYGIVVKSKDNVYLYGTSNILLGKLMPPIKAGQVVAVSFDIDTNLSRGDYFVDVGFAAMLGSQYTVLEWRTSVAHFTIQSETDLYGFIDLNADVTLSAGQS